MFDKDMDNHKVGRFLRHSIIIYVIWLWQPGCL